MERSDSRTTVIKELTETGLNSEGDSTLDVDLVIFATGFRKILSEELGDREKLTWVAVRWARQFPLQFVMHTRPGALFHTALM